MQNNNLNFDVIVAGTGPSGMACALTLARGGKNVLLLERQKTGGRKILLSGNGRCNITNAALSSDKYYGDKKFIDNFLSLFSFEACRDMLSSVGVLIKEEDGGRYFPVTESSQSVKSAFEMSLKEAGVKTEFGACVTKISKKDLFEITLQDGRKFNSKHLVLACGSPAYETSGADDKSYALAESLGHTILPVKPAMCALELEDNIKLLHGARQYAGVELNGQKEYGEIIFSGQSVSGLPVLSLSRLAKRGDALNINFFQYMSASEFKKYITARAAQFAERKMEHFFTGILSPAVSAYILELSGVAKTALAGRVNLEKLITLLQACPFKIKDTKGLAYAMSACGGVSTLELNKDFSSKKAKNLFIIGEMADIDAKCGGYSLHYALGSGVISAKTILELSS